jgi:transposase
MEANERWERLAGELREENARLWSENEWLRERDAQREAELERVSAELAVLQRLVFGRSSERVRPDAAGRSADGGGDGGAGDGGQAGGGSRRGRRGQAGRRDYSHLPRVEVIWDFADGGYCCPRCGSAFAGLGDHTVEQIDWQVLVHRRRRYQRRCPCDGPKTVMAPGPAKAIGKGWFSNAFIARLLTERYMAGRSQNSLVAGLARQGAQISAATLTGTCARVGVLLAPLEEAITARSRDCWHLHADETSWQVFAPQEGNGPARWWLWVFLGPDTTCFVMDPTRAGVVLARHAGIDSETGQLVGDEPRRLVISSDFYAVYTSAGKKADGLVNLYCWAHLRRHFVRAGDANPVQLTYWAQAWLQRIKALYAAHEQLMAAWTATTATAPGQAAAAAVALEEAYGAWDDALATIDAERRQQRAAPGLQEPAKKALATLDREWQGLAAHRDYPMINLDNNAAERALRRPVMTRKNAYGSRTEDAARLAARIWTVTATAEMAGLNVLTYLTAYLDACGRNDGKPPTGPDLERFLPWNADPGNLRAWAQPPPTS